MTSPRITPAILIGGAGSRLWPLSRANKPKQFLNLGGEGTMFQNTLRRFAAADFAPAWLLAGADTLEHVHRQLDTTGLPTGGIIVEPLMRGTAAAVAAISVTLAADDPDTLVIVAPADHFIRNEETFRSAVRSAAPLAQAGSLVTFGITPTGPETGFGYIATSAPIVIDGDTIGYAIGRNGFREKPNRETAMQYIAEGSLWNAGIFLFSARAMIEELRQHAPQTLAAVARACGGAPRQLVNGRTLVMPDAPAFAEAPVEISIDVAVMEKTDRAAVVPCRDIGWNDIGSLSAIWDVADKDSDGNAVKGKATLLDVRNSLIHAHGGRRIVAAHVRDLLVVDTHDALIILPAHHAQSVKQLVGELKVSNADELRYRDHANYHWGEARVLATGEEHAVLTVQIDAGRRITNHRCRGDYETWLVTRGALSVDRGDRLELITAGQSVNLTQGDVVSAVAVNEVAHVTMVTATRDALDIATHFHATHGDTPVASLAAARTARGQDVA